MVFENQVSRSSNEGDVQQVDACVVPSVVKEGDCTIQDLHPKNTTLCDKRIVACCFPRENFAVERPIHEDAGYDADGCEDWFKQLLSPPSSHDPTACRLCRRTS